MQKINRRLKRKIWEVHIKIQYFIGNEMKTITALKGQYLKDLLPIKNINILINGKINNDI